MLSNSGDMPSQHTLDSLLKPLNLKVDQDSKANCGNIKLVLVDELAKTMAIKYNAKGCYALLYMLFDNGNGVVKSKTKSRFSTADDVINALKTAKLFFVRGYDASTSANAGMIMTITAIDNPYFKSRSLEEMMITRDLLV